MIHRRSTFLKIFLLSILFLLLIVLPVYADSTLNVSQQQENQFGDYTDSVLEGQDSSLTTDTSIEEESPSDQEGQQEPEYCWKFQILENPTQNYRMTFISFESDNNQMLDSSQTWVNQPIEFQSTEPGQQDASEPSITFQQTGTYLFTYQLQDSSSEPVTIEVRIRKTSEDNLTIESVRIINNEEHPAQVLDNPNELPSIEADGNSEADSERNESEENTFLQEPITDEQAEKGSEDFEKNSVNDVVSSENTDNLVSEKQEGEEKDEYSFGNIDINVQLNAYGAYNSDDTYFTYQIVLSDDFLGETFNLTYSNTDPDAKQPSTITGGEVVIITMKNNETFTINNIPLVGKISIMQIGRNHYSSSYTASQSTWWGTHEISSGSAGEGANLQAGTGTLFSLFEENVEVVFTDVYTQEQVTTEAIPTGMKDNIDAYLTLSASFCLITAAIIYLLKKQYQMNR